MKYKKKMGRMKEIMETEKEKEKKYPEIIEMNINEEYSEEKLEEIKKKLTCKERTKYEICQLDNNYCLFLSSMYF